MQGGGNLDFLQKRFAKKTELSVGHCKADKASDNVAESIFKNSRKMKKAKNLVRNQCMEAINVSRKTADSKVNWVKRGGRRKGKLEERTIH